MAASRSKRTPGQKVQGMFIAKGDVVEVIAGADKGTRGKVLKVFPDKKRVIVEKVRFIKRHTKPTQSNPTGGILEKEAPIHVSNVMLIDPGTGERTRVGFKRLADGGKERIAKKSGEMIQRHE